jgi:hypothetical protein
MQYTDRDSRIGTGVNISIKVPIRISHQMASITCFMTHYSQKVDVRYFSKTSIFMHQEMQIFGHFAKEIVEPNLVFRCFCRFRSTTSSSVKNVASPLAQKVSKRFHNCLSTRGRKITLATCFLSET